MWHHFACLFATKNRPADMSLVKGAENIRPEDLDRLTQSMGSAGGGGGGGGGGRGKSASQAASERAWLAEGAHCLEYAKSNRSTCAVCEEKIDKDAVRIGRMQPSERDSFDGLTPSWAHLTCAVQREPIDDVDSIHGLDELSPEDQQDVRDVFAGKPIRERIVIDGDDDEGEEKGGRKTKKTKKAAKRARPDDDAKEAEDGKKAKKGKKASKKKKQEDEEVVDMTTDAVDYSTMSAAQLKDACKAAGVSHSGSKAVLAERLTALTASAPAPSSSPSSSSPPASSSRAAPAVPSSTPTSSSVDAMEAEFDRLLKEEASLRWSIRDPLKASLTNAQLKEVVSSLGYPTRGGPDRLLDTLTDLMMYGVPPPCPECGKTGVYYQDGAFRCGGFADEWARCGWTADEVERGPFEVPDGYEDMPPFDTYAFKPRRKPVEAHQHKARKAAKGAEEMARKLEAKEARVAEAKASREKAEYERDVLVGLRVAVHGKTFTITPAQLKALISERGGEPVKAAKGADVVLSTEDVVREGKGKLLKDAAANSLVVLSEAWLHDSLAKRSMQPPQPYALAQGDAADALAKLLDSKKVQKAAALTDKDSSSGSKSVGLGKSGTKSGKIRLKKGARAAVDADSGLEESGHILEESESEVFAVTMSSADVQSGHNSYYILQLIEADAGGSWTVFRKWGRLGTEQGNHKLEPYTTKAAAKTQFAALYHEKTGNRWSERHVFRKVAGRFTVLEQDYSIQDDGLDTLDEGDAEVKSALPPAVQNVVRMLFDVKAMQRTLLEMDIDLSRMPLGKLSKSHIQKGYDVLTTIQTLIGQRRSADDRSTESALVSACNQLYSLIPRSFGNKQPPLIRTTDQLKAELEMVESLLEMSTAVSMLKADSAKGSGASQESPVDAHYRQLKARLTPLDHASERYSLIEQYLRNTHAATHRQYSLELLDVFEVEREGEAERFAAHASDPNRMLLWHGSRTTNYVGILSQGLRIAPPEAPVSGSVATLLHTRTVNSVAPTHRCPRAPVAAAIAAAGTCSARASSV